MIRSLTRVHVSNGLHRLPSAPRCVLAASVVAVEAHEDPPFEWVDVRNRTVDQ